MKIYVASSWRNQRQPECVAALRDAGHDVYDFKNPEPDNHGFHWSEVDGGWQSWTPERYVNALNHPIAVAGYNRDMDALINADACLLVMPCGRSAHLEAGIAIGMGKPTFILLSDGEPELMYKAAQLCLTLDEAVRRIDSCCHYECKGGWNVATSRACTHTAKVNPG